MIFDDFTPLFLSLKAGLISTFVVFVLGVWIAWGMNRRTFPGKSVIEALLTLPLVLPPTVMGFVLLALLGRKGFIGEFLYDVFGIQIPFTQAAVIISAAVVSFPLMYQSAKGALLSVDHRLENAARTLGASEWYIFRNISIPLAWPGLLSGIVLSFARGIGEFGATLMLAGNIPGLTETIPLAIYFAVESGDMERAQFWVIIISLIGFCLIFWLNWWSQRNIDRHAGKKGGRARV